MSTQLKEIAVWLHSQAADRREKARNRIQGLDRNATVAQLKEAKAMAEHMSGRKLDFASTTRKSNIEYCDMQDRIAEKMNREAQQLSEWAQYLLAIETD